MQRYARWLFGFAAFANLAFGAAILFAKPVFVRLLGLDPIIGTNLAFANLTALLVATFGYAYARIAADPVRYRPLIPIGAAGKLAAVAVVAFGALRDPHLIRLAILVSGDAVFAALFIDYLRRT